jgi:acetone carboxylase gamma subunit
MTKVRISRTLSAISGFIVCNECSKELVASGNPWKQFANLHEVPVSGMPGSGTGVGQEVVLRQFSCPSCGSLLDTETAMPGDPFLNDVLKVGND